MTQVACAACGVMIQQWTAEENGGMCRPCAVGRVACAVCGKPMVRQPVLPAGEHICIPCHKKRPQPVADEVEYNGVPMAREWADSIVQAQKIKTVSVAGKRKRRIAYGDERDTALDSSEPCGDCAVIAGQLHVPGCDVEQCPNCRGQLLSCGCSDKPSKKPKRKT